VRLALRAASISHFAASATIARRCPRQTASSGSYTAAISGDAGRRSGGRRGHRDSAAGGGGRAYGLRPAWLRNGGALAQAQTWRRNNDCYPLPHRRWAGASGCRLRAPDAFAKQRHSRGVPLFLLWLLARLYAAAAALLCCFIISSGAFISIAHLSTVTASSILFENCDEGDMAAAWWHMARSVNARHAASFIQRHQRRAEKTERRGEKEEEGGCVRRLRYGMAGSSIEANNSARALSRWASSPQSEDEIASWPLGGMTYRCHHQPLSSPLLQRRI